MPGSDIVTMLGLALKAKWSAYANRNTRPDGELFYFELSADLNDRVVLFMYGSDRADARRRLEAALRVLGAGRLIEFGSAPVVGRLMLPLCPHDDSVLAPLEPYLFGLVMSWRCGARGCHYKSWTLGFGAKPAPPQSFLDAGSPYDIDKRI